MATEVLPPSPGRIKRQVSSRIHRFATICPPGFEDLCLAEARTLGLSLVPDSQPSSVFEWTGRLDDLYRACLFSRIASRILVRLDHFHAGAREELFYKATNFPWELWLAPSRGLRVDAHVEYSRISHEGQASETLHQAITRRMSEAGVPLAIATVPDTTLEELDADEGGETRGQQQRILLRIIDNQAEISLDACGEHLHRRGWRRLGGAAPLRENLAAGLLIAAGWPGTHQTLVDGMAGSGTFSIEASRMAAGWPAAQGRDFAFCHWPAFAPETFAWLRRQTANPAPNGKSYSIVANELNPDILRQAQTNAISAQVSTNIVWRPGDFFDLKPTTPAGLLVLNPPYGIRLSDRAGSLYPALAKQLTLVWQGWEVLLLGPTDSDLGSITTDCRWERSFRHGGLRIRAWLLRP